MRLQVLIPEGVFVDREVSAVIAEGADGLFGMLPRHVDFVSALVPGLLLYRTDEEGEYEYLGVDEGILVKRGETVSVSARGAVRGPGIGELRKAVEERFRSLDEHERQARSALAKMEAEFVRRFLEWERHG
jgi:F-type H+-transporting ATPase subunit epsilon